LARAGAKGGFEAGAVVGAGVDSGVGALVSTGTGLKDGVLAGLETDFAETGRPVPPWLQPSESITNIAVAAAGTLLTTDIWLPPARADALSGP
jgi:hypothetical protein